MNYSWSRTMKDTKRRFYSLRTTVLRKGECPINNHHQHERELNTTLSSGRIQLCWKRFPTHVCDNVTRSFEVHYLLPEWIARAFKLAGQFVWIKVETGASM